MKTEKKERERARNKFAGTGNGMYQIKIFLIFVPYLGQIYSFGHKNSFFSETKAPLGPWQLKN